MEYINMENRVFDAVYVIRRGLEDEVAHEGLAWR